MIQIWIIYGETHKSKATPCAPSESAIDGRGVAVDVLKVEAIFTELRSKPSPLILFILVQLVGHVADIGGQGFTLRDYQLQGFNDLSFLLGVPCAELAMRAGRPY